MKFDFNKDAVILASASPRRKELLEQLGITFMVHKSQGEEKISADLSPKQIVVELASQKAREVAEFYRDGQIVVGADTIVVLDNTIMGKPHDRKEAYHMIHNLQGRVHQVYTGVCLICREKNNWRVKTFCEGTDVSVSVMSHEEIEWYIGTNECMDKAGAYGIQGRFAPFINGIHGDYYNVVGLPLHALYTHLNEDIAGWELK